MIGNSRIHWTVVVLLAWPAMLLQGAQDPASVRQTGNTTITTVTGQRVDLDLSSISGNQIVGQQRSMDLSDAMVIETRRRVVPSASAVQVILSGGGSLQATRINFDGENFQIVAEWGTADVATDTVSGMLLDSGADRSRFDQALTNRSIENDVVIAKSSQGQQAVSGILESIDNDKLVLNYQGRSRPISLTKVIGIVTADLKPSPPDGLRSTVRLVDGGSIHGALIGLESGTLALQLSGNVRFSIPWEQVSNVSLSSSSVSWLSDMEPASAEHTPLATLPFEWQQDLSADRNPMTLVWPSTGETRVFAKGVGTRAASRLEFLNSDGFHRLVATVGIDAEMQGHGNCEVSVWGDGIQLWSAEISGQTDPVSLDLGIADMDRITLVVRNGKHLDLGDHVDWAEARFVRTAQ